jgi:hypothetical protein
MITYNVASMGRKSEAFEVQPACWRTWLALLELDCSKVIF